MGSRLRHLLPALGVALTLVAGCSTANAPERAPGDPITREEADVLAGLLHRNQQRGGADFVVTAPYGDGVVLTLTGEVDFRRSVGRAQAVTSFGDGRPDDTRTLFFTPEDVWVGDVPGLAEAMAAAGSPDVAYLRRPLTTGGDGEPLLADVLVQLLLNLAAGTPDDAAAFLGGDHTWEGQRSIDSRLNSVFGLREGRTVAVSASGDLLTQFTAPLQDGVDVTVTLSDHGPRRLDVPAEEETAEAADHPELAAALGI